LGIWRLCSTGRIAWSKVQKLVWIVI
jgi:hypothetical protein